MVLVGGAKKLLVLVLVATTVAGPLLFKSGQHLRVLASGFPLPREDQHHSKQDQAARPLECDHQDYSSERCMFTLEAALRSDEGIELIRSMLDTIAASTGSGRSARTDQESMGSSQVKTHQQHTRRDTRAAAYGPSKTSFVQEALIGGESSKSHSEALNKLLMNGLAHEEYNLLDSQDKPLWGGAMSDELGTRWQPMRGKRAY